MNVVPGLERSARWLAGRSTPVFRSPPSARRNRAAEVADRRARGPGRPGAGRAARIARLVDAPRVQAYVAQAASQVLGRPVRFASFSVSAFPSPALRLKGLQLAEDPRFGTQPFLTVAEGRAAQAAPLLAAAWSSRVLPGAAPARVIEEGGRLNIAASARRRPARAQAPRAPAPPHRGRDRRRHRPGAHQGRVIHYVRRGASPTDLRLEKVDVTVRPSGETLSLRAARSSRGGVRLKLNDARWRSWPAGASASRRCAARWRSTLPTWVRWRAPWSRPPAWRARSRADSGWRHADPAHRPGELTVSRLIVSEQRPQCPAPPERKLRLDDVRLPIAFKLSQLERAAHGTGGGRRLSARLSTGLTGATRPWR
jgi:hypothetical protein